MKTNVSPALRLIVITELSRGLAGIRSEVRAKMLQVLGSQEADTVVFVSFLKMLHGRKLYINIEVI